MKTPRVAEALQHIDDELISEAIGFQRSVPSRRLLKICACFLAIAVVLGIGLLRFGNESDGASTFGLSAYAISNDETNTVTKCILEKGQKVPISAFETESGIIVFAFGQDKPEKRKQSWCTIVFAGNLDGYRKEVDDAICDVMADHTQDHFIYIPEQNKTAPYKLTLFMTNWETGIAYRYEISIIQVDDCYYAELEDVSIAEPVNIEELMQ